ncbi:MAG: peptidoglycan DD-metalloendopeptidase family protein [Lachnospiraceae bacterium]|nr:peptidoglycan DD-metalloendopeptidase family protein [Lachnospiraceae bacterium]
MRDLIITSSILILAVLLIRRLVKGRLAPILQYALWLPVVFRLLFPIPLWSSSFSVLNLIPESGSSAGIAGTAEDFAGQSVVVKAEAAPKSGVEAGKETGAETKAPETGNGLEAEIGAADPGQAGDSMNAAKESAVGTDIDGNVQRGQDSSFARLFFLVKCLPYIWAAGILLVGGYMLFYQIKWNNYLRANRIPLTGRKKYRGLNVYTVEGLPSPCLTGRCIYLTKEMAGEPERLEHILAHEYCHYKQLDSLWVIVRCVLTAVYWFHPLVWAAAYVSKQDSELACDAAAIRLLGEKERLAYGKTLLCLIAGKGYDRNHIGLVSTMSGGEKGIKERIFRIAGKPQYMVITAGVVLLLIAVVVAVTFSGTKEAQGQDSQMGESEDLSALADSEIGQEGELSAEQQTQQELEAKMAEERAQLELLETQQTELEAAFKDEVREQAILQKLSSYDKDVRVVGEGAFGITGGLNPSDYVQAYAEKGDAALDEGMYLLERRKGPDGSDIKIYGMYSKEYGCEGIKIIIGNDVNDFDEEWILSYMHGLEENLRVYESTEDGMPRTFACKMVVENTHDREFWNLYVGDRYDTGTIELYVVRPEEFLEQIRERVHFEINTEESRVDVYDDDKMVGSVSVEASAEAMESVEEVIIGGVAAAWELGSSEEEIRMLLPIGLKPKTTDDIWYGRLPLLSISVSCGSFGDRKVEIGQVSVDTEYVHGGRLQGTLEQYLESTGENSGDADLEENSQQEDSETDLLAGQSDDGAHYDVEIQYINPCPSYTRISDSFVVRTHPVTGEEKAHNGIDFAAEKGADVLAAADGTVYRTGFDSANGNYVILYHALSGEYTYYTHCQEILVTEGNSVTAGQKIAAVGSTGRSTGPHLHFALSRNGEYIEPVFG